MADRIRIAVVGLGNRGLWAIKALQERPEYELIAVVDSMEVRLSYLRETQQIPSTVGGFTNLPQCLRDVELDAVAVFTPDGTHAELVEQTLAAGKWLFVEKPLDITADRLARIIEADRKAGGKTFVGFNLRYAPMYHRVKTLIDAGEIGKVLTIQTDEFYDGGRTYFRRWNRLRAMGGGLWITKGCHDFDVLYWLAGAEPTAVYASSELSYYRPKAEAATYCRDCQLRPTCPDRYDLYVTEGSMIESLNRVTERATGQKPDLCLFNSDKDTFDHGQAMVRFANGVMATYTVNVVAGFTNRRIRVGGTRATLDGDLNTGQVIIRRRDPAGEQQIDCSSGLMHGGGDERVIRAFADFVNGLGSPLVVRPAEAAVAVRMGLAAEKSCTQGQRIDL